MESAPVRPVRRRPVGDRLLIVPSSLTADVLTELVVLAMALTATRAAGFGPAATTAPERTTTTARQPTATRA